MPKTKQKDINQLAKSLVDKIIEKSEVQHLKIEKKPKKNLDLKVPKKNRQ